MDRKYRSSVNISDKIRITVAIRFHEMADKFSSGKELFFYNKKNSTSLI